MDQSSPRGGGRGRGGRRDKPISHPQAPAARSGGGGSDGGEGLVAAEVRSQC